MGTPARIDLEAKLLLLSHHVEDAEEAIQHKQLDIAMASIKDIGEIIDELNQSFGGTLEDEIASQMG